MTLAEIDWRTYLPVGKAFDNLRLTLWHRGRHKVHRIAWVVACACSSFSADVLSVTVSDCNPHVQATADLSWLCKHLIYLAMLSSMKHSYMATCNSAQDPLAAPQSSGSCTHTCLGKVWWQWAGVLRRYLGSGWLLRRPAAWSPLRRASQSPPRRWLLRRCWPGCPRGHALLSGGGCPRCCAPLCAPAQRAHSQARLSGVT